MSNFYPSSEQAALEGVSRSFRYEDDYAYPAQGAYGQVASGIPRSQAGTLSPSLYTGKMEKVAQVAMGIKGVQNTYNFNFYHTDGIYIDNNNNPWIISISLTYGIVAMRLPVLSGSQNIDKLRASNPIIDGIYQDLGFIPTGKNIQFRIS